MFSIGEPAFRLACALAIGLLIGAERERRKGEGPQRSPAGLRTFALASLLGGVSVVLGGNLLLAVTTAVIAAFCAVAYLRTHEQDPGLTSETALVLTVLLGGLAQTQTATASALAVVVTVLLAARRRLHYFVSTVISEEELTDALIFAAATLVVLPLDAEPLSWTVRRHQPAHHLEDRDPDDVHQRRWLHCGAMAGPAFWIANRGSGFGIRIEHRNHWSDGSARVARAGAGESCGRRSGAVHGGDDSADDRGAGRDQPRHAVPDALSPDRVRSGSPGLRRRC